MDRIWSFDTVEEKVPWLGKTGGRMILLSSFILPFLAYLAIFWWFDQLILYGALISQFVLAIILCVICYFSTRYLLYDIRVECKKAQVLPDWVMPLMFAFIFAPWLALTFHPLIVGGSALLPCWAAIPLALFIIVFSFLMRYSAMVGGFSFAHAFSIYLFFPEEGTRINKGIYSYVRHPLYAGCIYTSLGFAILRNNLLAIFTAIIFVIPNFLEIKLEDKELIERFGQEHGYYVKETPAIFPHFRDIGKFFKLIFSREGK